MAYEIFARDPDLLLAAIKDVAPADHPKPRSLAAATPAQRRLFETYVAELMSARAEADSWWEGMLGKSRSAKARAKAEAALKEDVPIGPADHARVIATVRRNWLRTAELNANTPAAERVPPEYLVLAWLREAGHDDLTRLVASYPFFPVGLDADDHWV
jgi:hypothetical protein